MGRYDLSEADWRLLHVLCSVLPGPDKERNQTLDIVEGHLSLP